MNKDNMLILIHGYYYFFDAIKYPHLKKTYNNYEKSKFFTFIKRLFFKCKLPGYSFFFEKWKKNINTYTDIVIFDTVYHPLLTEYIKLKNKSCKIKLYFWNSLTPEKIQALRDKNIDEFWTFDYDDAQKYKLFYNPQFYTKEVKLKELNISYDALFLGRQKERINDIKDIQAQFNENGINAKMIIVDNNKNYISYYEYLKLLSESKSVIDIVNQNQVGLTLRCMESLFFRKKLITNNKQIKQYEFYNKNNIFIVGENDFKDIKDFLNREYEEIDRDIIEKYDFETWKNNFMESNKRKV